MQRTLKSSLSRSHGRFAHKGTWLALAAFLGATTSACGESGLDVGDDTARVGSDEEVGRAGDGDESMESDSEEMTPATNDPAGEDEPTVDEHSMDGLATDNPADGDASDDPADEEASDEALPGPTSMTDGPSDEALPGPTSMTDGPSDEALPTPTSMTDGPSMTPSPTPVGNPAPSVFPQTPMPAAPCDSGLTNCAVACVDLTQDSSNCGACGLACQPGESCLMGVCASTCGNAVLDGMETCDDGNATNGDGCGSNCQPEPAFACPTPGEPCTGADCGNGIIENEACDDGNDASGDGCSDCEVESGWSCAAVEAEGDAGADLISECTSTLE